MNIVVGMRMRTRTEQICTSLSSSPIEVFLIFILIHSQCENFSLKQNLFKWYSQYGCKFICQFNTN